MPSVVVASHAHLRGDALIVMEGPYTVTSAFMLTMWSTPSIESRFSQVPEDDVAISDGHGYMVSSGPYKDHLKAATDTREVGFHSLLKNQGSLTFRLQ